MSDKLQLTLKYQQLLRDLKTTVEGLVNSQVANVWSVYGGLNRLHVDVEKIFKNGCKSTAVTHDSVYWNFIQGLEWLQPDPTNSTFMIDCECKAHIPRLMKNDRAAIWLHRSLENHSLSQKLSWLLSDKTHLLACYQPDAYFCQEVYAEATLICLRAVERNEPSLLSEIKPNLFLPSATPKEYYKIHRRCSSFPDSRLRIDKIIKKQSNVKKTTPSKKKLVSGKLRTWHSNPNLENSEGKLCAVAQSCTTPCTPNKSVAMTENVPQKKPVQPTKLKHVIINNYDIIEHIPVSEYIPHKSPIKSLGSSAPEYSFLSTLSGISGAKDYKNQPRKTFIEDGGSSVLPMATGYFPRPMKGQTLTSFLLCSQFAKSNAELDRENAHFSISEAVIAAMEQIKCRKSMKLSDSFNENDEQRIRMRRKQRSEEKSSSLLSDGKTDSTLTDLSAASTSSSPGTFSVKTASSEEVDDLEIDEASNLPDNRDFSMSMASLYSEADLLQRPRGAPDGASDILSAEGVALSLISKFNEQQLPRASDLEWLVSEEDVPQALLPMPKSWTLNQGNDEPLLLLRGTREWAPPRPQIIFTLHQAVSRKDVIAKQNYRCAGCGIRVAQQYASKFRYCTYLGRYFCTGCHTNQLAIIPANVIQKWNFKRYPVSTFSYRLLEQMSTDPLFRIFDLNKNIAKQSRNLQLCRKYRTGLRYLRDYILTCRFAERFTGIQDFFECEQPYIYNEPDIYSLEDLINVRSGDLKNRLHYLVKIGCRHASECELCLARGYICEICNSDEVLFPWQLRIVHRCGKCGCCYHIKCWQVKDVCQRCMRIGKRKEQTIPIN